MNDFISYIKIKKNLINLLSLLILILSLPLGVNFLREQQVLRARAVGDPIKFTGPNVEQRDGKWIASKPKITLQLISDLGPPAGASASRTVQKDGGLVGTVYAGHLGSPGTFCDETNGNALAGEDANGEHYFIERCANRGSGWSCQNGACVQSGGSNQCDNGKNVGDQWPECRGCDEGLVTCNGGSNYGWQSVKNPSPNCGSGCGGGSSPLPSASGGPGGSGRQCKATFTMSELGINDCNVCDRLHEYRLQGTCQQNNTCTNNSDCPQNRDQPNFIDPSTSNWCYGFADGARCLQLRYTGTGTEPSCGPGDTPRGTQCDASPKPGGGGGTVGECTVSWQLSNENPSLGSTIQVKVRGVSDPKGWQNIELYLDGSTRDFGWGGIEDPHPTFVYNSVPAGSAGSHTLKFTTDKNTRVCSPQKTFTSGTVTEPSPSPPPPSPSPSPLPSPSPSAPPVTTVEFRVAESRDGLDSAQWQKYTQDGMEVAFEFGDKTPGLKQVWVEFKDSNGKTSRHSANIRLLGPGPTITSCGLIFEGSNVVFDIKGQNFGSDKGTAKSGQNNLQIREWEDSSLKVVLSNPPTGQSFPLTVTNIDGQIDEGQCSAISAISLGAKVFCRLPSRHDTDNVDLILVGLFEGGQKIREIVRIDKNGIIQNLTQRLEEGKKYSLLIKAPLSLRRTVEITAAAGTTNVPNFILPVGDIFPADDGDGTINNFDKSALNRQWIIGQPATGRSGDFNRDTRVNSVDWACMRYDFGESDDLEPSPGVPLTTPPPPSPSLRPSPGVSPSPSPSATACIQVITPAKNPIGGECREFPTPCDVPSGWQIVASCSTN